MISAAVAFIATATTETSNQQQTKISDRFLKTKQQTKQ